MAREWSRYLTRLTWVVGQTRLNKKRHVIQLLFGLKVDRQHQKWYCSFSLAVEVLKKTVFMIVWWWSRFKFVEALPCDCAWVCPLSRSRAGFTLLGLAGNLPHGLGWPSEMCQMSVDIRWWSFNEETDKTTNNKKIENWHQNSKKTWKTWHENSKKSMKTPRKAKVSRLGQVTWPCFFGPQPSPELDEMPEPLPELVGAGSRPRKLRLQAAAVEVGGFGMSFQRFFMVLVTLGARFFFPKAKGLLNNGPWFSGERLVLWVKSSYWEERQPSQLPRYFHLHIPKTADERLGPHQYRCLNVFETLRASSFCVEEMVHYKMLSI